MNPFDFVKASSSGDSLMPIIIFVIWIAISFFTNARKKKKKLEQQARLKTREVYRAPEPVSAPAAPEMMTQNQEKRSPVYEEIRKQLETVLSKEQAPGQAAEPEPIEESGFSLESKEVEEQSYETQMPPEIAPSVNVPQPVAVSAAFASNVYDQTDAGNIDSSPITDIFSAESPEKNAAQLTVTHEETRNGIVWSEILALPKALREDF
jgi:hypothetical protein